MGVTHAPLPFSAGAVEGEGKRQAAIYNPKQGRREGEVATWYSLSSEAMALSIPSAGLAFCVRWNAIPVFRYPVYRPYQSAIV